MRSAFGVDHGEIYKSQTSVSKAYGQIAAKLERAAAAGHPYAQARVAAGQHGRAAAKQLGQAKELNQTRSLNPVKAKKTNRQAKSLTAQAGASQKAGIQARRQTTKIRPKGVTPGGLARMESSAAERIAANQRPGLWKKSLAIGGGAGLAGGGGAYAYQNRKRSA